MQIDPIKDMLYVFRNTLALIKKHATQIIEPRLVIGTREYTPCHFAFNAIKQTFLGLELFRCFTKRFIDYSNKCL